MSAAFTLHLGFLRPISSGNTELGAAKPTHRPPRGGGGGFETETGH